MRISDWSSDVCSSDLNSTSPSSRLVRRAAKSPDFAITGPDVARKPTPISRATICASVVLPSPGGAKEQHKIQRFTARSCRFNKDTQIFPCAFLAHELVKCFGPQRRIDVLHAAGRGDEAVRVGHGLHLHLSPLP